MQGRCDQVSQGSAGCHRNKAAGLTFVAWIRMTSFRVNGWAAHWRHLVACSATVAAFAVKVGCC